MTRILGINTSLRILGLVACFLGWATNASAFEGNADNGPEISLESGSGPYPLGTREMPISISTNIDAHCRYSRHDEDDYPNWKHDFGSDDNRFHENKVIVFSDEDSKVYIRCLTLENGEYNNFSFEFPIYFETAETLAQVKNLAVDSPTTTGEAFTLSWDSVEGATNYHLMEKIDDGLWQNIDVPADDLSITLDRPISGRYLYKVSACLDTAKSQCGEFSDEIIVSVGEDENHFPPVISYVDGSGPHPFGTKWVNITVSTNIDAECRYNFIGFGKYQFWNRSMSTMDNRVHYTNVRIFGTYDVVKHIRCRALATGYTNTSGFEFHIDIVGRNDLTPPQNFAVDFPVNKGSYTLSWDPVELAGSYLLKEVFKPEKKHRRKQSRYRVIDGDVSSYSFENKRRGKYKYFISACSSTRGRVCTSRSGPVKVEVNEEGAGDQPPEIVSEAILTANVGSLYQYDVEATDPDNNESLLFSLDVSPEGMTIDATSGIISWTPEDSHLGDQDVTVTVSDSTGLEDSESFVIDVQPPIDSDGDGVPDINDVFPNDPTEWEDSDNDQIGNNADPDDDNDGVEDSEDAFPFDPSEQFDTDSDGVGNNADPDDDNDGIPDENDAFPLDGNEWIDSDGDGIGDNGDTDDDNDGVPDVDDAFPYDPNESLDTDGDGIGNNADNDDDNDGVLDVNDAFPLDPSESVDTDGDGIGNTADPDDDNDGVLDINDAFPLDPNESIDTDGDGIGNNADNDDDNDGVLDINDAFPLDASESVDTDGDGVGNNADTDDDSDGVEDINDAFPLDPTETLDTDSDGVGNNEDTDDDNDGVEDVNDAFPLDENESVDTDGDGIGNNADTDDDDDGVDDANDAFPLDENESIDTDSDGIGNNADTDDDGDGVVDGDDAFPLDPEESVDTDGDGIGNNADADDDNDGVEDSNDAFPLDPNESVDTDSDGIGNNADSDDDNDGVEDTNDAFPLDPNESVDSDADGIGNNADTDDDNDGVEDAIDAFPLDPNESVDTDADGIGNNADTDDDNDGVEDAIDAFPLDPNESVDTDADGIGNNADTDDDNDGVEDANDAFPLDPNESVDTDADGIGNNADTDDDNDGVEDSNDAFPLDPSESVDTDSDGIGNNADTDDDNDGVLDSDDAFPLDPNESSDLDGDGIGDNSDTDRDGDGVENDQDVYPEDASRSQLENTSNLSISLVGEALQLNWSDIAENTKVAGYHIERALWGQAYVRLTSLPIPVAQYIDSSVENKQAYQYRLVSYSDDNFESVPSNEVANFVAYNNDSITGSSLQLVDQKPVLNWNSLNADQYVIYRGQQGTSATPITVITENTFTDNNTVSGNRYIYQIQNRKNFVNPITGESFSLDGPISEVTNYYHALELSIEITNATKIEADSYQLIKGAGVATSITVKHINAEGPVDITLTDGTNTIVRNATNGDVSIEIPTVAAVWNLTSSVNTSDIVQGASANLTLLVDDIAPQLNVNGPSQLDSEDATIVLTGTATDDQVLDRVEVSSSLSGNQIFQALLTNDSFEVEIPLSVGENVLIVTATDNAGNESSETVTVNKADLLKPVIEFTSHTDNQTVSQSTVTIAGRVQSNLPKKDIDVKLGSQSSQLSTNTDGSYGFSFADITLSDGINTIVVRATSTAGDDEASLVLDYQIEAEEVPAVLEIISPLPGSSTAQTDFVIQGNISGSHLTSLTANGVGVHLITTGPNKQSFNFPLSFAENANSVVVNFVGIQGTQEAVNHTFSYFLDNQAPVISVTTPLQESPTLNEVNQNPFVIDGTVTDDNLSALFVNDKQVSLMPGSAENEYEFSVNLQLETGVQAEVEIKAQDSSSNFTTENFQIITNAVTDIDIIAPTGNKDFLITDSNFNLQVLARVEGIQENETVRAKVNSDTAVPLALTETLASGDVLFTATSGEHTVTIEVVSSAGEVVNSSARTFSLIDPADIPLEMVKTHPVNSEAYAEPNGYIGLYFTKPIDPSLLSLDVRETVSGKSYIKENAPGADFLEVRGYQLRDVNRSNEPVPGGISQLPGDNVFAFYPSRDIAYGASVFVTVNYDGEEFYRFAYKVRPLPTFVSGAVYDQLEQPVAGIKVELQDRVTYTDADGGFDFGYGEAGDNSLATGVHKLVINREFEHPEFGIVEHFLNVELGRQNQVGVIKTIILNKETPFQPVQPGQNISLAGGELNLDLTDASLIFPNGNSSGNVHVSFLELSDIQGEITPIAIPAWMFAVQPAGIKVSGAPKLSIKMPKLYGGYEYTPDNGTLVLLVSRSDSSNAILPVGVGEINGIHVQSVGSMNMTRLDNIGYAFVAEDMQEYLREYADGEINLPTLIAYLQQQVQQAQQ